MTRKHSAAAAGLALCGLAMAGLAWWAFLHDGATLLTVVAVVIAAGCFAAMVYAWWLARRALKPLEPGAAEKAVRRVP